MSLGNEDQITADRNSAATSASNGNSFVPQGENSNLKATFSRCVLCSIELHYQRKAVNALRSSGIFFNCKLSFGRLFVNTHCAKRRQFASEILSVSILKSDIKEKNETKTQYTDPELCGALQQGTN